MAEDFEGHRGSVPHFSLEMGANPGLAALVPWIREASGLETSLYEVERASGTARSLLPRDSTGL